MHKHKILLIIGIILLIIILAFIAFRGCSMLLINKLYSDLGSRDWRIELQNGYEIHKLNGNSIILTKDNWSGNSNIVIPNYINAYCYNNDFIGVWCAKDGRSDLLNVGSETDKYYLVDTSQNVLFGPYTKTEYEIFCESHLFTEFNQWIFTNPRPSTAVFD